MSANRDIDFLYEIGSLRNVPRGWRQHLGFDVASDLEHTIRLIWLALIISRMEKSGDENKIIKMALVHDVAETRVSDLSYVQKVYVKADEHKAADDMFKDTIIADYREIIAEYEKRESIESKIVKDADNLDIDIELKEIEELGSQLPEKWAGNRRLVRDTKLYTESAKKLWDQIQESDPSSWHMKSNKWIVDPTAGK
ncbi:MAG: HD domain-containing protein [Candidatus Doudnabacteria bacterium]|nr:HD domain-containing protein [Candidatus Doudnabacteria bacterium]